MSYPLLLDLSLALYFSCFWEVFRALEVFDGAEFEEVEWEGWAVVS